MADRWRDLLAHDGYVVVRLRLLTPGEGGRSRALQSGYRADWLLPGAAGPTTAPIDLVGDRRSIRPGEDALVRAHPMEPELWCDLAPTARIDLWRRGGRLGTGVVEELVDVPDHPIPLRRLASPRGDPVWLTRKARVRRWPRSGR